MTTCLWSAVELLDRAVAYTRGTLAHVAAASPSRPTPCAEWDLGQLLLHMDDSLSAFIEGSRHLVSLSVAVPSTSASGSGTQAVLDSLHTKACALLGAWSDPDLTADAVRIGDQYLDRGWVATAGALEIAVHGWDVGVSTGHPARIPEALAAELSTCADHLVAPMDRPTRFAAALPCPDTADTSTRLLAFLGRTDPTG
ncbi:MAG: TIGR03086 family metal-binding protein [Propionibacteriaceae bacterium]